MVRAVVSDSCSEVRYMSYVKEETQQHKNSKHYLNHHLLHKVKETPASTANCLHRGFLTSLSSRLSDLPTFV